MALNKVDISMIEDVGGANNLVKLDANAKIPAGTGANLLNKPGPLTSASDPAIDSNKTLGTEWLNSTSGEMYVCTDATAGANVWTNVGAGSGDVSPYNFQGSVYGYAVGGADGSDSKTIEKFSLTSDGNSTDAGNLSDGRSDNPCGQKSKTHGYCSGGYQYPSGGGGGLRDVIDKWSFAGGGNATDVGNLTVAKSELAGQSSENYGFVCGSYPTTNVIERFSFTTDGNATDWADLTAAKGQMSGHNSATYGYCAGGYPYPGIDVIEKFPFASQTNATDVGDLTNSVGSHAEVSSTTHGYAAGGGTIAVINKFSFDTGTQNATDAGDLTVARSNMCGVTSTTHGYACGGDGWIDVIDKFSTVSDANATDVGNLIGNVGSNAGSQY